MDVAQETNSERRKSRKNMEREGERGKERGRERQRERQIEGGEIKDVDVETEKRVEEWGVPIPKECRERLLKIDGFEASI